MKPTMQGYPLTIQSIFRRGRAVHRDSTVSTYHPGGSRTQTFEQTATRALSFVASLRRLGVPDGARIATLCPNRTEHIEVTLAAGIGGYVLHTLNARYSADQLSYVVENAADHVLVVDVRWSGLIESIRGALGTVRHIVAIGEGGEAGWLPYEDLVSEDPIEEGQLREPDEAAAASICYTTGTTGRPKGVVYSHRSTWLHALSFGLASAVGIDEHDVVMPLVPLFHVNGWGTPYASWYFGSDLLLLDTYVTPHDLVSAIGEHRPSVAFSVPLIWRQLLDADLDADLSSVRMVVCAGSSVSVDLIDAMKDRYGIALRQAFGMTETSPFVGLATPSKAHVSRGSDAWKKATGRPIPGVEVGLVSDDGELIEPDGETVGELVLRGPWVTAGYHNATGHEGLVDSGWFRSGDLAVMTPDRYFTLVDRKKDVIKSGGEWISSVVLEDLIASHASVSEAAVVGVPDESWDERPLAALVAHPDADVTPEEISGFLEGRVPGWWIPEQWTFVDEIPRTSVGKIDKRALRQTYEGGGLDVTMLRKAARG